MEERERIIRQTLKDNYPHYSAKCLKIRSKSGVIEPFVLNRVQKYIDARIEEQRGLTGKVRAVILKGRQQGCSTYIGGRFYHKTSHRFGCQAFILTHALDATSNLFKMAKRFHDNCPKLVQPEVTTSNTKELIFGRLDSGYKIGTAENKSVGRSATIQLFHGSEVAFWANAAEHAKGILQAIPDMVGTEVVLESTANGVGNYFHQVWQNAEAGISDYIAIFVPWFWQEEYRKQLPIDFNLTEEEIELKEHYGLSDEQIYWRRQKITDLSVNGQDGFKAFKQEYPCNAAEAFQMTGEDTYILPELVMRARKAKAEPYGPLLIGVDPARFGDDRTSIIRRRGRVAFNLQSYVKKDTMEVTGYVHNIIITEKPSKVFIDVGGLGAGIVDRLIELGHGKIIIPVNSGSSALLHEKYVNKRAEMWGQCKEWLLQEPCQIPDIDSFQADMCGVRYTFDSNSRLVLEKKETMKKRGIRSPDEAEALMLTFAYPVSALANEDGKSKETAVKIMSIQNKVNAIRTSRR